VGVILFSLYAVTIDDAYIQYVSPCNNFNLLDRFLHIHHRFVGRFPLWHFLAIPSSISLFCLRCPVWYLVIAALVLTLLVPCSG
jgi:hypothetical protein